MNIKKEEFVALVKSARTRVIATILMIVICACTIAAAASSSYNVNIIDGENVKKVQGTTQTDAKAIVKSAGFTLKEKDELDTSKFTPGKNVKGNQIEIVRSHKITFQDSSKEIEKVVAARNVKEALKKANITLSSEDKVSPSLKDEIIKDTVIKIDRANTVKVVVDGETNTFNFFDGTVKDILDYADIKIGKDDVVTPALDEKVKVDDVITVSRVEFNTVDKTESIPFNTVMKKTTSLYSGQSKVTQLGKKGEQIVTYNEKVVDGKVVESTPTAKKVTQNPVDCVKQIGTKVTVRSKGSTISTLSLPSRYALDADGIPTNVKATITGLAKAYTAVGGDNITSCGVHARPGYIAVNPRQIPYGTEMYIVSKDGRHVYGYCIAADTGGFVKRKTATCDLYMNTRSQCFSWGNKNVNIYILKWGNGRV